MFAIISPWCRRGNILIIANNFIKVRGGGGEMGGGDNNILIIANNFIMVQGKNSLRFANNFTTLGIVGT